MKKLTFGLLGIFCFMFIAHLFMSPSEDMIRSNTLQLFNKRGSCSGEQIRAPSGQTYVLTAAHCRVLADEFDSIMVKTEDGRVLKRRVIEEDAKSDLLLLEGVPGLRGLEIAKNTKRYEHVRTFTHGNAFKTYKTEGHLIQEQKIFVPIAPSACPENAPEKLKTESFDFLFSPVTVCMLEVIETASTAKIAPGSSGGMVVNDDGELVGVVSAGSDTFSFFVTLKDINRFVGNY